MRVLIVGGGIGGLTAAIALRRVGVDAVVFERRRELREIQFGAGMILWSNALYALQQIDLASRVQAVALPVERACISSWRGEHLGELPAQELRQRMGVPSVSVTRANLYAVLSEALPEHVVRLDAECTTVSQDEEGVTVRLADGREERGDVLVAADGRHSRIRTMLVRPEASYPPYIGYTHWSGEAEVSDSIATPGEFHIVWGTGEQFYYFHVQAGRGAGRVYWAGTAYVPRGGSDLEGERKSALLRRYGGWRRPIATLIEATDERFISRRDIRGGQPLPRWGTGRMTLLGDAAHPMSVTLGQGGCTAIEDAVVLARELSANSDPVAGLRTYESQRMARTSRVMQVARGFDQSDASTNPFACSMRNWFFKQIFTRPALVRRLPVYGVMSYRV